MKILKLFIKIVGYLFLALILTLLTAYILARPQYEIPGTVAENPAIPHITIDSLTVHAETYGDPASPSVIVIHGGPGEDYRSLLPLKALADSFHVVFYDQRGTGLSPRVETSTLSLTSSLNDLSAIINHFSPEDPVILIGHSWGAMLASGYIASHPERVNKAVLAEPGFLTTESAQLFMERTRGMMPPMTLKNIWKTVLLFMESIKIKGPDEDAGMDYLLERLNNMSDINGHPMAGYYCDRQIPNDTTRRWRMSMQASQAIRQSGMTSDGKFNIDLVSGLERFDHEVLFLTSACNTICGEDIQRQHMTYFAHSEMVIIPDAGHYMIWDQPERCLTAIRTYLKQ